MYTNNGKGNAELANLPRKLNIALSPSRDDFPHTHINDVGLVAVKHPDTGEVTITSYAVPSCVRLVVPRAPVADALLGTATLLLAVAASRMQEIIGIAYGMRTNLAW